MSALANTIQRFLPVPNTRKTGPIGLEFSLEQLHLVQMETGPDGGIALRACASVPLSGERDEIMASPKQVKSLVRRARKQGDFQGHRVVASMPSNKTRIVSVAYQVSSGQADAEAILSLMADRLEGDLTDYVIDYLPVRANPKAHERLAIVAVSRRDDVIKYLELLRYAGLTVDSLEIGPAAIRRLIGAMSEPGKIENVLVINFGRTVSYLTIISKSRLLFDQEISYGENRILELIASNLEVSAESAYELVYTHGLCSDSQKPAALSGGDDDISVVDTLREIVKPAFLQLVGEINRALIYAASQTHGESVSRIFLLGGIARWVGADRFLQELIELPVQIIPNPLKAFPARRGAQTEVDEQSVPEIAVAAGLALRGMTDRE